MIFVHNALRVSAGIKRRFFVSRERLSSVEDGVVDAGSFLGGAILGLQLTSYFMAVSEHRDWVQYYFLGAWVAMNLAFAVVQRWYVPFAYRKIHCGMEVFKLFFAVYAAVVLTHYFAAPIFTLQFWWIWAGGVFIAWQCTKGKERVPLVLRMLVFWLMLTVVSVWFTFLYMHPVVRIPVSLPLALYATPFMGSLLFAVSILCRSNFIADSKLPSYEWVRVLLYGVALYALVVPCYVAQGFAGASITHHWKSFLESASSVRTGGWLLWDVLSQYGFLQTLVVAFIPVSTTWESFYLLNCTLQLLVGFGIFAVLFSTYRSLLGYVFSLSLAVACTVLVIPGTLSPHIFPSTGVIRFFWVYAMVGYVFFLCKRAQKSERKLLSPWYFVAGNVVWILGVLWATDSAAFVTVVWLPSLFIMAYYEACDGDYRPRLSMVVTRVTVRLGLAVLMMGTVLAVIGSAYYIHHHHFPDLSLWVAYIAVYQSILAVPIQYLGFLPCWVGLFLILGLLARAVIIYTGIAANTGLYLAAIYSAAFAIWASASYYVPFSENYHISGTLPLLVFVTSLTLWLLPVLGVPNYMKLCFEKAVFCFYAVIIIGTASHFNYDLYGDDNFLYPIETDVTRFLLPPPETLRQLILEAKMPENANVQVIYDKILGPVENMYVPKIRPWLLPNAMVAYASPLPVEVYREVAARRIETADASGWVIETKQFPLHLVWWLESLIFEHYKETAVFEKGEWRIRKFEALPKKPKSNF